MIMAFESIAHANRHKFLAAIRPVFVNGTETTEIRIAAIAALFRTMPSFLELQQLTAGALWERNAEVLNLIVTSMRNFAGSKNPFLGQTTKQPQLLLHRLSHIQTSHFRWSNRVLDFQDQKYGLGGGLQLVKDDSKALAYLTLAPIARTATVTRGEQFRHGQTIRENVNANLGMESNIAVYNCETYTGKAFIADVFFESFKPSEINSHGSIPGFFLMGLMQMRNYFYQYSPYGMCSMKAVILRSRERPTEAVEIKLKMDTNAPVGKKAASAKRTGT